MASPHRLVFVQIFFGDVILWHLVSVDFALVSGVFHSFHHVGLERIPFLEELVDTLRLRAGNVGQSLQVSRLPARA